MSKKKRKDFQAFTTRFNGVTNQLISDVSVSLPFHPGDTGSIPKLYPARAIWDTGAMSSCITKDLAQKLQLKPISKCRVYGVNGESIESVCLINIYLPNHVALTYVRVTECKELMGGFNVLIGMDIINTGDFAISKDGNKTLMSFRFPSIRKIDFVEEAKAIVKSRNESMIKNKKRLGREEIKKRRKKERQNRKKARSKNRR